MNITRENICCYAYCIAYFVPLSASVIWLHRSDVVFEDRPWPRGSRPWPRPWGSWPWPRSWPLGFGLDYNTVNIVYSFWKPWKFNRWKPTHFSEIKFIFHNFENVSVVLFSMWNLKFIQVHCGWSATSVGRKHYKLNCCFFCSWYRNCNIYHLIFLSW